MDEGGTGLAGNDGTLRISGQRTCHDGWNVLREYHVEAPGDARSWPREVVHRPDLAVVLAYSSHRRTVTLIRQLRLAAQLTGHAGTLLEAPSGRVDAGEQPEAAGRRELAEETGLLVSQLAPLASMILNPALSTERAHLFACDLDECLLRRGRVDARDMPGGVQVLELPMATLTGADALDDAKTALIVALLRLDRPELFEDPST